MPAALSNIEITVKALKTNLTKSEKGQNCGPHDTLIIPFYNQIIKSKYRYNT